MHLNQTARLVKEITILKIPIIIPHVYVKPFLNNMARLWNNRYTINITFLPTLMPVRLTNGRQYNTLFSQSTTLFV